MSAPRRCFIDGLALWSPSLPGWDVSAPALRGGPAPAAATGRPAPAVLAANERRRAPDSVLLALEVAAAALAMSGRHAADVATVFASAHGDLPITDALCKTLAADPRLLSPTRFHHSVHNAASGYWAIGSGSTASSTALAAAEGSFATGLLEALTQCAADRCPVMASVSQATSITGHLSLTQCAADRCPVMLVACDTEAIGPLRSVNSSRGLLAVALLLAPEAAGPASWALDWHTVPGAVAVPAAQSTAGQTLQANASSPALPLFEALARGQAAQLAWPLSATVALRLGLSCPTSTGQDPAAA